MRLIFTFVPNWHCFKLRAEDRVSTFFGCFCFWSWWLWAAGRLTVDVYEQNSPFTFYLVSKQLCSPWPGALPLQLRDPNYGNGDTNTFSKRMFEQFTEYLIGWQICQLPLSSEGSKLFSFRGFAPWPLSGALPPDPRYNPPTANPLASPLMTSCSVDLWHCSSENLTVDVFTWHYETNKTLVHFSLHHRWLH